MKEIKEDKKERKEPQVILQLPDDLSVGIMTALIHAHLQNIMEPGLGFRHHAKKVLKKNNLPDLDLGNGDSWGIFKVLPPKTINTTTETTLTQSTISPHPPQPDLGPQDEPETELFTTPQRKPTSTPTPTPAPTPTQSPVRPRTTKTNTPKQSPQQPRPQTTQSVKPKTTHIHRKHTDDLTDSEVDDQSLRHRDGYDLNPKTYGIRLFATEPSRYKHLNRLQLAHEITRGTIKWIYTDNSYQTRIHEQKITQHLHEGNMFIQPNMIEKTQTPSEEASPHSSPTADSPTSAHTHPFIRDNSSTTPDIVLANTQANLNHHITTDDVTSSDHLPVILTLSTNPIMNFQISPAENTTFDPDTETEVTQTLQQLQHLILPSQTISLNTLSPDDPLSRPITPEDMRHAHTRTNNTTPGASNINKLIMQHLPPIMLARLRHIFNAALATGYFPSRFKRATLVLIPKPGKPPHEVTSFRPISLLEVPGKMLERLITHRLKTHLENNNTHNTRQHGFRPHRGTGSAIALAYEEIALSLANKHQTNIILRDVTKAFDKVWHDGLKYKITQLHLPPHLTRLLCNFLDDRSANIRLGSYLGPSIHLRSGVPQGSVLSPTLYTLYTASLPPPAPYSNYTAYADDITQIISHPSKSKNIMKAATQTAINTINTYENKWKIQTNTKTNSPSYHWLATTHPQSQ
ncbi:putative RNA-directed DNA polymerase from transposon X-element [Penaeus vannamei]|uniref:Putative RNA-directed DNA polymerase from transposon X-element n=1 Tax=Penaeus vannamei TaxID=6689 RepID=A0A3R7Q6I0_PENVA|nr:putative RNA-directed DNA polymerase from transposon X-element [Penaeus vannamei]